jgi:hypothetical protein
MTWEENPMTPIKTAARPYRGASLIALICLSWSCRALAEGTNLVCNKGPDELVIATLVENSNEVSLRCEMQRVGCHVVAEGWFHLAPGKCQQVALGNRWETYLSIYAMTASGKYEPRKYTVKEGYRPYRDGPISTGLQGLSLCAPQKEFKVRYEGIISNVLQTKTLSCVAGTIAIPINAVMHSDGNTRARVYFN